MRRLLTKQLDTRKVRIRLMLGGPPTIVNGWILNSRELGDTEDTLQIDVHPTGLIEPEQ